jgi:hypothetical protein
MLFDFSVATTQFTGAERKGNSVVSTAPQHSPQRHPIMNWVVVTDNNAIRQLRLQWCMAIHELDKKDHKPISCGLHSF